MQPTAEKVMHIVPTLEQMLLEPFPIEQEPHDEDVSFEYFERFLAKAPDRLVKEIDTEYFDDEDDEVASEDEYFVKSLKLYDECLVMIEQAWGPGNKLSKNEIIEVTEYIDNKEQPEDRHHPYHKAPGILFDENRIIRGDYGYAMTWWPNGDRVAVLHYTADFAGGKVMAGVSICVLPVQTTYQRPDDY